MARDTEQALDRLYQLPLSDFTRERNRLAKERGGDAGTRVRELAKPSAAAWAVNQLYWRDRKTYDALVTASGRLRAAHHAILGGRKADLRQADADHRAAVKAALSATLQLAGAAGQNVSAATHTEISQTLERLPGDEPPGRMTRPLRPEGFEALQGMPVRPPALRLVPPPAEKKTASGSGQKGVDKEVKEDAATRARARKEAERARRDAQRALQAAREQEKKHRAEVARLENQVAAAERATTAAKHEWERAQHAEHKARGQLREAGEALERSETALREAEARARD